jgi:hypothetical protein
MLSGAVIMIIRSHSARDGASRLTLPVPDGNCRARSWPGSGNGMAKADRPTSSCYPLAGLACPGSDGPNARRLRALRALG